MGFFRKDAEQPAPVADETGTTSSNEKFGDEKVENVEATTMRVVSEEEEQRLIRKLDRRIVPMMVS